MATRIILRRTARGAVILAAAFSVTAPSGPASAQVTPAPGGGPVIVPGLGQGPAQCSPSSAEGQGSPNTTTAAVCNAGGLVFIGPALGGVSTAIGPTTIGPAVVGNSNVSAGNGIAS